MKTIKNILKWIWNFLFYTKLGIVVSLGLGVYLVHELSAYTWGNLEDVDTSKPLLYAIPFMVAVGVWLYRSSENAGK